MHKCNTCRYHIATCKGNPVFGIDIDEEEVAYTRRADEVVYCSEYWENTKEDNMCDE